jgi:hypothetical protein
MRPQHPTHHRRRFAVLLMAMALHQLIHVVNMLTLPVTLENLSLSPVFEVISGTIWMLVFTALSINVWRSFATTRQVIVLLTIFSLFQILRLAAFAQADYDRQRLPFLLLVWLMWVSFWGIVEFSRILRMRLSNWVSHI